MEVVGETIKTEAKEEKGTFLSMLLGTFDTNLLGNMLAGKDVLRVKKRTIRSSQNF